MNWLVYASVIAIILIGIFPTFRLQRPIFLPKAVMNVSRCASLHNEILRLSWEPIGRAAEDFQPKIPFEHHSSVAEEASCELSHDLVVFLQGAYELYEARQQCYYCASALLHHGGHIITFLDQICEYEKNQVDIYDG